MARIIAGFFVVAVAAALAVPAAGAMVRAGAPNNPKPSAAVATHLLVRSALPPGWAPVRESSSASAGAGSRCLAFLAAYVTHRSQYPWASRTFEDRSSRDQWAEILYETPSAASAAVLYAGDTGDLAHCDGIALGSGSHRVTGRVSALEFIDRAPQSQAFTVALTGRGSTLGFTVHIFRAGNFVGGTVEVADDGFGYDAAEQATFDAIVVEQLGG